MNTNQRLRQLKDEHSLTKARIAELTASSIHAADQWLVSDKAKKYRQMPAAKLELLEIKLAAQAAGGK